ncbi:S1C family serine protease [Knoellia koreensis]|uniref:PDZ domain-containing protein n=1 Tax=Knoellia koreensis TaxID=2730921 RepID=A0A849HGY2_9MICO|nr:trypsin-like peptidase domain-containing protein [Knoellia sp. DB2414S]NNM46459.1 PDZ domain-containing protein [Knoellia sp. DB2414S]
MRLLPRSRTLTVAAAGALAVGTITFGGAQLMAPPPGHAATVATTAAPPWARDGFAWGYGDSAAQTTTTQATTEASDSQLTGVVDIVTTVNFGQGEAAGTGIVLTSGGEVLTNNHVVSGSTSIKVTALSTGRSYAAKVVGTSATNDIAVLQLEGASGLATAPIGTASGLAVGDEVTGVGNAGNEPGTAASPGTVTDLDQQITASDGTGSGETLTGLIETSAAIASGDSGGPLLDADGRLVGIDTAAQTDRTGQTVAGYAIPIDHALDIASQILAGADNATISQGVPAFLGVQTSAYGQWGGWAPQQSAYAAGVTIAGVVTDSAADRAGLTSGDTITAVGGTEVASADELTAALAQRQPGDKVAITWTDATGTSHTATVTLGEGPAA